MVSPAPQRAVPRVRTAKHATQRRISHKKRARYRGVAHVTIGLAVALVLLMAYVWLTAHLTSLNYAYAKAERQRASLQGETARLDEQLAALRSDERLSAIALRLHMQDPQQFALVTLPSEVRIPHHAHVAILTNLAGLFGVR